MLSDTKVYAPQIRASLGATAHFCRVVVLKFCEDATRPACKGVGTSDSASLEFSDYSQVNMLALQ